MTWLITGNLVSKAYGSPSRPRNKWDAGPAHNHSNPRYQHFVKALVFLSQLQGASETDFDGIFVYFSSAQICFVASRLL